mmetsp:Transcript_4301/g.7260  ORF Transcript_4301/g.7260 Transcript_4301/m.7260 type:complete len:86 (-) Transcript_4301:65-322(-)
MNSVSLDMVSQRLNDSDSDVEQSLGFNNQPIFVDLMIKIMLCRVFVNVMDRKLLTAERILGNAEALIKHVEERQTLQIVTFMPMR